MRPIEHVIEAPISMRLGRRDPTAIHPIDDLMCNLTRATQI